MRKLWDFRCPDGHVSEHFVETEDRTVRCECGLEAQRIISPLKFSVDGSDPAWPTAHDKWVREHERAGSKSQL